MLSDRNQIVARWQICYLGGNGTGEYIAVQYASFAMNVVYFSNLICVVLLLLQTVINNMA